MIYLIVVLAGTSLAGAALALFLSRKNATRVAAVETRLDQLMSAHNGHSLEIDELESLFKQAPRALLQEGKNICTKCGLEVAGFGRNVKGLIECFNCSPSLRSK